MIADARTRALRRWKEVKEKGNDIPLEEIEKELIWRDKNDITREISPLIQAEDAIPVDTSKMSINEQVQFIYNKIKRNKYE